MATYTGYAYYPLATRNPSTRSETYGNLEVLVSRFPDRAREFLSCCRDVKKIGEIECEFDEEAERHFGIQAPHAAMGADWSMDESIRWRPGARRSEDMAPEQRLESREQYVFLCGTEDGEEWYVLDIEHPDFQHDDPMFFVDYGDGSSNFWMMSEVESEPDKFPPGVVAAIP